MRSSGEGPQDAIRHQRAPSHEPALPPSPFSVSLQHRGKVICRRTKWNLLIKQKNLYNPWKIPENFSGWRLCLPLSHRDTHLHTTNTPTTPWSRLTQPTGLQLGSGGQSYQGEPWVCEFPWLHPFLQIMALLASTPHRKRNSLPAKAYAGPEGTA